ncbi:MAG TPA: MarR family transcriptional regulator [Solirubrobacterales bacterium]|nr:MarR family transcriptional regulator [Solirubrobacterales bacterium]
MANSGKVKIPSGRGSQPGAGGPAREAWGLLSSLVYPPPFAAIAREFDLRPAAFGTLRMLDRPRTMSEVATALQCDNSNVTGIVDSLEEKGLAQRRASEEDRRVKLIELTAEGRRVHARLARAFATPPEWVESLSAVDQRALRDILARAVAARTPGS